MLFIIFLMAAVISGKVQIDSVRDRNHRFLHEHSEVIFDEEIHHFYMPIY
jgi:hypothetical protein